MALLNMTACRINLAAKALRARGCDVIEMAFQESQHVGHLKHHPKAYAETLRTFAARALVSACWARGPEDGPGMCPLDCLGCS